MRKTPIKRRQTLISDECILFSYIVLLEAKCDQFGYFITQIS